MFVFVVNAAVAVAAAAFVVDAAAGRIETGDPTGDVPVAAVAAAAESAVQPPPALILPFMLPFTAPVVEPTICAIRWGGTAAAATAACCMTRAVMVSL